MGPESPRKRPREVELCTRSRTPIRVSPTASSTSEQSPSDHSAMAPTTTSDKSTVPTETDPYESSELSDSSEAPSSESSSEEEGDEESDAEPRDEVKVENLRANRGKKPQMKLSKDDMGPDIRTFLKDFLPQLKAANDELEAERKAGTLKHRTIEAEGEEEGQYIEMDLGLGVLEERDPNAAESPLDSDDDEGHQGEKDLMGKLLGQTCDKKRVDIQEVSNAQDALSLLFEEWSRDNVPAEPRLFDAQGRRLPVEPPL